MLLDETFTTAPPRFAYESDSSDSAFEDPLGGEVPSTARLAKRPKRSSPGIELTGRQKEGGAVIVAIGNAGEAWTSGVRAAKEVGKVCVDDEQVASLVTAGEVTLVLATSNVPLDAQTPVALALLDALKPSRLHVIDSYSLQGYLGSTREDVDSPPLRFLQTDSLLNTASDRLHLYDVPNLVTGLSAAITGQAVQRRICALLVLAPSLAASSSLHSATTQPRLRPHGIYDPSETGPEDEAHESLLQLYDNLSPSEKEALGWKAASWDASARSEGLWAWLRALEREKERRRGDFEELYM